MAAIRIVDSVVRAHDGTRPSLDGIVERPRHVVSPMIALLSAGRAHSPEVELMHGLVIDVRRNALHQRRDSRRKPVRLLFLSDEMLEGC